MMKNEGQRMATLFAICLALTVITTIVAAVTITNRRATQRTRTQDSQRSELSATVTATIAMVDETRSRLRVATFANRDWIQNYAGNHPQSASLLVNRSTFVSDWNTTLFNQWAPQIASSPQQLYGFAFSAYYPVPNTTTVISPTIMDYTDFTWNGTFIQFHSASDQDDDHLYAHLVTRSEANIPVMNPAVAYDADGAQVWYWDGDDDYWEGVMSWATVDGSSFFYLTDRAQFFINDVLVQVQSNGNTYWADTLPSKNTAATCVVFDNFQKVVASDSAAFNTFMADCQRTHSVRGTRASVDACLGLLGSAHPVPEIREMFAAAYPDNSSAEIVDEMRYVKLGGITKLMAVTTLVDDDNLHIDVVCVANDMSNADTGTTDVVLSLFPAGGSVVILLALVCMQLWSTLGRGTWKAPKDMSKPMAMMFTDVQSSTALWARDAEAMSTAIEIHHATIRKMIRKHSGYEVKTIGDAFMVAFKDPRDAVRCALAIQLALLSQEWPEAIDEGYEELLQDRQNPALWHGLRVRIGLHYGKANISYDVTSKSYDYYGTLVNTAARVEAVGHGGQVLLTSAVVDAVGPIPDSISMGLGRETLRGLSEPVDLVQLLPTVVHSRSFPALRLEKAGEHDDNLGVSGDKVSSSGARSNHSSCYNETFDFDAAMRTATAKLAASLPHVAAENVEKGVASEYAALEAFFAVGDKDFKRKQLSVFCEKWGVPVHHNGFNFEHQLIRVAAKVYAATAAKRVNHSLEHRLSLSGGRPNRALSKFAPAQEETTRLPGATMITITHSAGGEAM